MGTGVAFFRSPDPLAPFLILGTSAHADRIQKRYSVGNVSPYLELGVAGRLLSDSDARTQPIFTLGVTTMVLVNYLLLFEQPTTTYYGLKFGVGLDRSPP